MLYLACPACKVGLRVSPSELGEAEVLLGLELSDPYKTYYCFQCDKQRAVLILPERQGIPQDVNFFDVSPEEAFVALSGLGLPGEQDCGAAAVREALLTKRVVGVNTHMIRNSHRCIIESIEFEDGLKMYLGSSAGGALVYRMAPKNAYGREVQGG